MVRKGKWRVMVSRLDKWGGLCRVVWGGIKLIIIAVEIVTIETIIIPITTTTTIIPTISTTPTQSQTSNRTARTCQSNPRANWSS